MSPEQATALIVAITGLVGALGIVLHNIAELRKDLNGRLQELIDARVEAAQKRGELAGRDFVHRLFTPPPRDED
jgi:hypothetical protein